MSHIKYLRLACSGFTASLLACAFLALAGCTKLSTVLGPSVDAKPALIGRVSLAPVSGATISFYDLKLDGSRGSLISSTTTDATGSYVVTVPTGTGALLAVASGGSYSEEAGGQAISVGSQEITAVVPSGNANRALAITPLTHIAAQRATELISSGISLSSAITAANQLVAEAAGLSSGSDVTSLIPADPSQTLSAQHLGPDSDQAKYALVLAAISQLAQDKGISSINVMRAFADDFKQDGSFDGAANGTAVSYTNDSGATVETLTGHAWDADLSSAASSYLYSGHNTAGFTPDSRTSLQPVPVASGSTTLTSVGAVSVTPSEFRAVVVQPDDRIIAAGSALSPLTGREVFFLERYLATGALDTSFGTSGRVATSFGGGAQAYDAGVDSQLRAIALQSDGKILAGGLSVPYLDPFAILMRYNANGSIDKTFGFNGVVRPPTSGDDGIYAIAVQPDGKIVAAGQGEINSVKVFSIWRFNPDGHLDTTFGTDGRVLFNPIGGSCKATAIVIQPADGKIVVAGNSVQAPTISAVIRLNPDGSLDEDNFGGGGAGGGYLPDILVVGDSESGTNPVQLRVVSGLILLQDGSLLVSGTSQEGSDYHGAIVKVKPNGELDSTYGESGFVTLSPHMGEYSANGAIALVGSGSNAKILVAGSPGEDFGAQRLNLDGSFDNPFGGDGTHPSVAFGNITSSAVDEDGVFTAYSGDYALGVGVLANGDFVIVGLTESLLGTYSPNIEFHNADGTLKTSIGTNGSLHPVSAISIADASEDKAVSSAIQSDGKLVVIGTTGVNGSLDNRSTNDLFVLRYNADGSLDSTFGPGQNGKVLIDLQGNSSADDARHVVIAPDGKILVLGQTFVNNISEIALVRLNNDGSLDSTFNGGIVHYNISSLHVDGVQIALQSSGKPLVLISTGDPNGSLPPGTKVLRFGTDGVLDTSFGTSGAVDITAGDLSSFRVLKADQTGRIYAAGAATADSTQKLTVVRLTASGAYDSTFGTSGISMIATLVDPYALLFDSSGRLVLGGTYYDNTGGNYFAFTRLTAIGDLDTSFGTAGKTLVTVGNCPENVFPAGFLNQLALDSQSRIIGAGTGLDGSINAGTSHRHVTNVRLSADGMPDATFGSQGVKTLNIASSEEFSVAGLNVSASGEILLVGTANASRLADHQIGTSGNDVFVMRYTP